MLTICYFFVYFYSFIGTNATSYHHKMTFSCETNSNLTAQVRAVTNLNLNAEDDGDDHSENGVEVLYGRWSPAGNFNCGGNLMT